MGGATLLIAMALFGDPEAVRCPPPLVSSECVHGVPLAKPCWACFHKGGAKRFVPADERPPMSSGRTVEQPEGNGGPEPMAAPCRCEVSPACCCDQSEVVKRLNEITATLGELRAAQGTPLGTKYALAEVRKFHAELANLDRKTNDLQASLAAGRAAMAAMSQRLDGSMASLAAHENSTAAHWKQAEDQIGKVLGMLALVLLFSVVSAATGSIRASRCMARAAMLLLVLVGMAPQGSAAGIEDCIEATVRVSVQGGIGTGCVFHRDGDTWYILTNCHVAERPGTRCRIEFWRGGYQSPPIPGVTVSAWMNDQLDRDMAVVAVQDRAFPGAVRPRIIPLAPRGTKVPIGATVLSVGCARGAWPSAWKGHVFDRPRPHVFHASPPAENGRSGSAVFDTQGKMIVGLIAWRDDQAQAAVAQTIEAIYKALDGVASVANYPPVPRWLRRTSERACVHGIPLTSWCGRCQLETQCGPGGCSPYGGGSCGPGGCPPYQGGGGYGGGGYEQEPEPYRGGGGGGNSGGPNWRGFDPWSQQGPTQPEAPQATPQPLAPLTPVQPDLSKYATRDYVDQGFASIKEQLAAQTANYATASQVEAVSKKLDQSLAGQRAEVVKETQAIYRHVEEREQSILGRLSVLVTREDLTAAAHAAEQGGVRAAGAILVERVGMMAFLGALGVSGPLGLAVVAGAWILRRRVRRSGGSAGEPFRRVRRRPREADRT